MPTNVWNVGLSVWIEETRGRIPSLGVVSYPDVSSLRVKASGVLNEYSCHSLNVMATLKKG